MTVIEAAHRKNNYKPLAVIKSQARTLEDINRAIKRELGVDDIEKWFDSLGEVLRAQRAGFISFHDDGFILWYDGD